MGGRFEGRNIMSLDENNVLKEIIKKVNYELTEEMSQYQDNLFKDYGELF